MIHLDHLTYTYPGADEPALSGVSLEIREGQFVLLAGLSGGGKSTLLRCLNGLVPHFSGGVLHGHINVSGYDPVVVGPQVLSRVVGFVFQDPEAQFVLDRVEDEIAFGLENAAVPPDEMRLRVEEVLHLLDLSELRDRPLAKLSGGEKQRVAIAAALALRPRILALDEPTSQLDPQSAEEVLQALVRLNQDLGLTIVLAEHRLERVLPYVDQLIYLDPASTTLIGPPRDVLVQIPLTPPLVTLGKAMGWSPLPLTVKEARPFAGMIADAAGGRDMDPRVPAPVGNPLLRLDAVSFAYNAKPVLRDINLTVGEGELVALMGRNGVGKSTMLKCIVGLLQPQHGHIMLGAKDLIGRETADICKDIAYLPQTSDDLLFADTVADELAVTLRNHDLLSQPPVLPDDLIARLGLAPVRQHYPRDLSVGQRQRVALAAITVTHPRVLLLDEPTRGLDYWAKQDLLRLLLSWKAEGMAILLTTHDVEFVAYAAERVVILGAGEVIADVTPAMLTTSPLFCPQIARLFPGCGWLTPGDVLQAYRAGEVIQNDS